MNLKFLSIKFGLHFLLSFILFEIIYEIKFLFSISSSFIIFYLSDLVSILLIVICFI